MEKSEFTRRVTGMRERLYRLTCGMLPEPQDRMDAVQEAVELEVFRIGEEGTLGRIRCRVVGE